MATVHQLWTTYNSNASDGIRAWLPRRIRRYWPLAAIAAGIMLVGAVAEIQASWFESMVMPAIARQEQFSLQPGSARVKAHSADGPYDQRLGFAGLSRMFSRLEAHGFDVAVQARDSGDMVAL